jgi:hypothetical protein
MRMYSLDLGIIGALHLDANGWCGWGGACLFRCIPNFDACLEIAGESGRAASVAGAATEAEQSQEHDDSDASSRDERNVWAGPLDQVVAQWGNHSPLRVC